MKRRTAIKNLLGVMAATIVPTGLALGKTLFRPKIIYKGFVAGYQFYEGEDHEDLMKTGDPLTLVREPENREDKKAIAVFWNGIKLGYIPRRHNLVLKNMLDEEIPVTAQIRKLNVADVSWRRVRIEVRM